MKSLTILYIIDSRNVKGGMIKTANQIYELFKRICEEQMPEGWAKANLCAIHKKGNKTTMRKSQRSRASGDSNKILTQCLSSRLNEYLEKASRRIPSWIQVV